MESWDSSDRQVLLQRCVGLDEHGQVPDLGTIRANRRSLAHSIFAALNLTEDDTVLDLGSGPGCIARWLAPRVKQMHCADIAPGFLALCQEELQGIDNAFCHLIPFGDLSALHDIGITAVYASALFIHFNIYDVYIYLQEIYNVLAPGGRVWFDYKPFDLNAKFQRHLNFYRSDREMLPRLLNYQHPETIDHIARHIGFDGGVIEGSVFRLLTPAQVP